MLSVAAKPARRPLPALNTARYAMFGPGVSSITRHVRPKAPIVGYVKHRSADFLKINTP
jgi:hypothetical protein